MAITSLDRFVVYRRTDDTDLVPLGSPTTDLGANVTTTATGISIGFTFTLDGVDYTTCALSARGFLRLAGSVTSGTNSNLFGSSSDVVLAPWWDSIETAVTVGYVKHEVQGTAPWRRFVAEWYVNLSDTYDGTNYVRAKMQCVLYENWNQIDFRYGSRESGGSPANTGSASVGIKGVTSVATDNYRDFAVDNLSLGGSKTTSTTNLRHYASEWPTGAIVCEPAWPMVGFYVDTSLDDLTGIQHPYGDPARVFASNSNWHYCRHTPALVNASPWHDPSTTYNNPVYVVPITPSADGRAYQVYVEAYQANGSPSLQVSEDAAADPQPATGADWSTLTNQTGPAGTGNQEWTVFEITPATSATFLRFKVTSNDFRLESVVVRPKPLDDFDPTLTYASGWQPVSIAQIRQRGAAVHPEFYNRCWRNAARVCLDLRQVLWSHVGSTASTYGLTGGTYPVRVVGTSACALKGWPAESVRVDLYAYDEADNALVVLGQRGGSSVSFDVDSNGTEYRIQTQTLALVGDEPVLTLSADPVTKTWIGACVVSWVPSLVDADYIQGTTPAAKLEYLAALASRQRLACLYAYAYAGLATMLRRSSSSAIRCAWIVGPAVKALRPRVARHAGTTKGTAQDTSLYGASSGAGAADEIVIPNPNPEDRDAYPPDGGTISIASGALVYDATPASAGDRLLESPTAGVYTGATHERVIALYGVGLTLVPVPDDRRAW